jgi:peptide/nickel transport system substrate-binding protein
MFRFSRTLAAATVAVLTLGVAACGGSSSSSSGTSGGGSGGDAATLTLGVITPVTTFSAQDMEFANQSPYGQAVYDTLLKAQPDGTIVPNLATEWAYNADNTVLTMTLRSDVTFTDGTKFDASAAAQNLIRFRDGASPNKSFLAAMKDAKAVDATHLEITLTAADPALLNYLTQNAGYQESPAAFTSPDIKTTPVGSGPYTLDTANTVVGSSYAFVKNPKYWDPSSVHYNNLVLKVFVDPTAMLNAVKGGQLNGAKLINNDALDQVTGAGYTLNPFELDWMGLLLLDRDGTMNPALKDLKVRQAINYAFDSAGLLKALGKGHGTQTAQIFPTSSAGYDPSLDSRYAYDPAKAKQLLADAGYPNGFTLDMPSTPGLPASTWTLIGQQLKDVGITANFTDAGNNFIADVLAPKYAATWLQLQQDPDWQLITFAITPTATFNPFKYTNPEVAALIQAVHEAKTEAESGTAVKALNAYIVENAWFAPWYRIESNYATDANTSVQTQVGNAYPYLWNFTPKAS